MQVYVNECNAQKQNRPANSTAVKVFGERATAMKFCMV